MSSNAPKTHVFHLLQPLPGDFRSNDVSSGILLLTWRLSYHVTATSCELQPCRSSNIPQTRLVGLLQPLQVISGQMTSLPGHFRSREVTRRHFLSRDCHLLRGYSPVGAQTYPKLWFSTLYRHFLVTSGQMT